MDGPTAKAAEKIAKKTREEKLREQKIESEILKSLNSIAQPDQKFQALLHRCVEAERISRSAQLQQKQNQKTIETLLLEKDNIGAEYQRVMLTKSKLESLCRELQNQNKTIKVSFEGSSVDCASCNRPGSAIEGCRTSKAFDGSTTSS